MVFTSTTPWKLKNVKFIQKVQNWRNWILSVPRVSVCREKKSPWYRQYQSYISNWYVNGKVFTSTTTWEPRNLILFQKVRNWIWLVFWLVLKIWNQHSSRSHLYVDIGDASSSLWGSTSSLSGSQFKGTDPLFLFWTILFIDCSFWYFHSGCKIIF